MSKTQASGVSKPATSREAQMSLVRKNESAHGNVLAILTSDWHISLTAPLIRQAESDWYRAQARPFNQINDLQFQLGYPEVTVSGDLFDKWNAPAELINWAFTYIPSRTTAVAGNHDTPNHNVREMQRSAYWTAFKAEQIEDVTVGKYSSPRVGLYLHGFPHQADLKPWKSKQNQKVKIALLHHYCWTPSTGYKDAPNNCLAARIAKQMKGFHLLSVGDNHIPFYWWSEQKDDLPVVINNGTLQRRAVNEIEIQPRVNLLHDDGWITPFLLDCSQDKFIDSDKMCEIVERTIDMTDLLDELKKMGDSALDFITAVKKVVRDQDITPGIARKVFKALEDEKPSTKWRRPHEQE